jgi:phosphoribosyl 1,2-cyclic phosphodiesterase
MSRPADAGSEPPLTIRFWGVRGSIPTADRATARFGGHTSCVEIVSRNGRRIILDAGTGIRPLGRELTRRGVRTDADIFLTHFHLDHVQGLLFFQPLLHQSTLLRIHAPRQNGVDARTLLCGDIARTWLPVPLEAIGAGLEFHDAGGELWLDENVRVSSVRVAHGGHTLGYRIDAAGASVVYVPDNELPTDLSDTAFADICRLAEGADLLIHDAMFTSREYVARVGWGHSTFDAAVELAVRASAKRLCFFHHAPERTDDELDAIVNVMSAAVQRRADAPVVLAAAEGNSVQLEGGGTIVARA